MGYTEERIEFKECQSIWGSRPPKQEKKTVAYGKCTKCGKEVERADHPETGEEYVCGCQCTLDCDFNVTLWLGWKENDGKGNV